MSPVTRAVRSMLDWSVVRKVTLVFFFVIVVFPLTAFIILQSGARSRRLIFSCLPS